MKKLAALILFALSFAATADDAEYFALARKASCAELIDAYKSTKAAELNVVAAMKESRDGTVATNVIGVASLAILGVGFFTWNSDHTPQENLDDLRNDLRIITAVANEKKCGLPVTTN